MKGTCPYHPHYLQCYLWRETNDRKLVSEPSPFHNPRRVAWLQTLSHHHNLEARGH